MNPFILLAILVSLMVVGHFVIKRFAPTTSVDRYYLPVHAGQNDGVLRPSRKYLDIAKYNLTNGGIPINESNYEAFIVDGESMSNVNIHSEDIVLVKTLAGTQCLNEFELHARAVLGLPIAEIEQYRMGASAVILSPIASKEQPRYRGMEEAVAEADTDIRIFGKPYTKLNRRMGVVVCNAPNGSDMDALRDKCKAAAAKVEVY